ncbi:MAG: thioredoxin domain-containing protein [Fimbriimonadaceae bacterium]|nr:thioredoxin domain-containing protein [Fimbriimonadaceae bacterium]
MPNRLADEASLYLRQHADNPIDWQPWDDKALAEARNRNVPIFLSVGYSSCHWCHVMAHESFEDEEVAAALNRSFVSIKLDREERPDLDEVYMTAVQVANGHGGWPMTLFLTPDLKPFFAGTYFPRVGRGGRPGFLQLVQSLATAWREEREKVVEAAEEFGRHLTRMLGRQLAPAERLPELDEVDNVVESLQEGFDYQNGGFGEAPNFPPHPALRFLLEYASRRPGSAEDETGAALAEAAGAMALRTLEMMALGGIHDVVGGGFHRYSTDAVWRLPHFEKMLSDNGQLLWCYAAAAEGCEDPELAGLFRETADGIARWVEREMTGPDGLFFSALDADAEGEEGVFSTWTLEEIESALGDRAVKFIQAHQMVDGGNFQDEASRLFTGRNVLHRLEPGDWSADYSRLLEVRLQRPAPARDEKCLASWNGLMISGLIRAGRTDLAVRAIDAWIHHMVNDLPPHQVVEGRAMGSPFLDDAVYLTQAILDAAAATGRADLQEQADRSLDALLAEFGDHVLGGLHFVGKSQPSLFARTKPFFDTAVPSPIGGVLRMLLRRGDLERSLIHVAAALPWLNRLPQSMETTAEALLSWPFHQKVEARGRPEQPEVKVTLFPPQAKPDDKGLAHVAVLINIPEGLHIQTHEPPAAWLHPTTVRVEGLLGEAGFPESTEDRYAGQVQIPLRLKAPSVTQSFEVVVSFQPCTEEMCFAPQEVRLTGRVVVPE